MSIDNDLSDKGIIAITTILATQLSNPAHARCQF